MGVYEFKGNGEPRENNEYSKMYDKSKYLYFLDAPFNLSAMCCKVMKKAPIKKYYKKTNRVPMTGQMASESRLRTSQWILHGCNAFYAKTPISNPLSFWTEQDALLYIYLNKLPIAPVYGDVVIDYETMGEVEGQISFLELDQAELGLFEKERWILKTTGCNRTGCMFCGYGCQMEKPGEGRFEKMKETHPKQYEYIMKPLEEGGLNYKEVIDWINEHNGKGTIIRY